MFNKRDLVLPCGAVALDEEEMTYVEGGLELAVTTSYLNKNNCKKVGNKYTASTGLGAMRIAKEVYAHAVMYYASTATLVAYGAKLALTMGIASIPVNATLVYIRNHANPINIGGDSDFRVSVYNAIWNVL